MKIFACLVSPSGRPISTSDRMRYVAARCCQQYSLQWQEVAGVAVLINADGANRFGAEMTFWGSHAAIGVVRLDNRADLAGWAGCREVGLTDLEIVARLVAETGDQYVPPILGDFGFVVWNKATRRLVAARDAFGVRKLYYKEEADLVAFASRAELLSFPEEYDRQYLAQVAASCTPSADLTAYAGVRAVPPGSKAVLNGGRLVVTRFWSPEEFEPIEVPASRYAEQCDAFRQLFTEAVRLRLTGRPDTWAQLSGGLDSSSIVSAAHWLSQTGVVPYGVKGTISWVYRWTMEGDEREHSDIVVRHCGTRNEVMLNDWFFMRDELGPPFLDQPTSAFPVYARDRRSAQLIVDAGGEVLLTGFGSDHYLLGNMFFFADWVAQGHAWKAIREMLRRAVMGRVSFWEIAYRNAFLPLLPPILRRMIIPRAPGLSWITRTSAEQYGLAAEWSEAQSYGGRWGRKYTDLVLVAMRSMASTLGRHDFLDEKLDVRHPFLYRPLVEFGLRLPSELCVQPHARKWVLR
jgi:asparagine synthase (glutamine-hydrolysing)